MAGDTGGDSSVDVEDVENVENVDVKTGGKGKRTRATRKKSKRSSRNDGEQQDSGGDNNAAAGAGASRSDAAGKCISSVDSVVLTPKRPLSTLVVLLWVRKCVCV